MEQFCGNLGNDTRAAWNKPKVAPQAPILPQEGNQKSTNVIAHHTNEGKNKVTLEMMESDHRQNAANIKIKPETLKALERFREKALRNKFRYEQVAQATGVPWFLIAAIHEREAGGNFNSYLHNGDPLGKPTIHVPAGKLFYDWETAAIDAIKSIGLTQKLGLTPETKDMGLLLTYAERYNGLGYRKPELGTTSPYVYAGTNMYEKGKYVRDGVYDPNVVDKQLGVAAMILALNGTEDYGHIDKNKAVA
jgi:lysozyme family protein